MGTNCNSCKQMMVGKGKELNMTQKGNKNQTLKRADKDAWGANIMGFDRESENFINVRGDDIQQKDTCHRDKDDLASKFDPNNYTSSHAGVTCVI